MKLWYNRLLKLFLLINIQSSLNFFVVKERDLTDLTNKRLLLLPFFDHFVSFSQYALPSTVGKTRNRKAPKRNRGSVRECSEIQL